MASERKRLIAGNWKMNCSRAQSKALAQEISTSAAKSATADIVIFPPSIHLAEVNTQLNDSVVSLGAQDGHWQEKGAFTGENSIAMLADYQVRYLLVGHSERREMFADSDERVANKFAAALKYGIKPILCIGESLSEREQGITLERLKAQCQAVIDLVGIAAIADSCIAYEPIWAIGTGKTASPEQAQEVHQALRGWLASQNEAVANQVQILYGGSMNATNAAALLAQPDIDGGLIGGASLKVEDFTTICSVAR